MELVRIWDIIWDNTPFHWATLLVFFGAVVFEIYAVWQYLSVLGNTEAAIDFLKNLRKNKTVAVSEKVADWLSECIQIDAAGNPGQRDGKFILLKYPDVLERSPRSSLRFVTTLCTAIGVLGTFYGIQEGLQDVNLSFADSTALLAAIKNLLAGMKTAFSTSLMGLGSGSLFTLVLFASDSLRQRRRERAIARLHRLVTNEMPNDAAEVLRQAAGVLSNLDFSANREAAETLREAVILLVQQFNPQAISAAASQQIERACDRAVERQLAPVFENIEFSQQRLLQVLDNLRAELIEPVVQGLHQSANFTQEASLAVKSLNRELGGISQNLATSILTIQNFQKETLVRLEEFADSLKGVLEDAAEIEQQMLQEMRANTGEILKEAQITFQQQVAALQAVGNEASSLIHSAKVELVEGLEEMNGAIAIANRTMQSDLEEFQQNYQGRFHEFFAQSIKGMQAQRRAFIESTGDTAATFQGIREDLQQIFHVFQARMEEFYKKLLLEKGM